MAEDPTSGATGGGATMGKHGAKAVAAASAGFVLFVLATGQFLMTLDSSVMNVSIATVAEDVGTTVTGIQTAITLYTLVMASLMITGGKVGQIIGRKRAFAIGCVIYGVGSFTTALAPNLTVLIIGWSLLEGIGAALIMPAIVALVAGNFAADGPAEGLRPHRRGGRDGDRRRAAHRRPRDHLRLLALRVRRRGRRHRRPPLPGAPREGRARREAPASRPHRRRALRHRPGAHRPRGAALLRVGLGRAQGRRDRRGWASRSTIWFILAGGLVLWLFLRWLSRLDRAGKEPLVDPALFRVQQLTGGLVMFFLQFLMQMGIFFIIPLFLSVVLGMTASQTGVRLLPLSAGLLLAAVGVPKRWPKASPRRVCRVGTAPHPGRHRPADRAGSTSTPAPPWSSSRCCSSASASARSPRSSGP